MPGKMPAKVKSSAIRKVIHFFPAMAIIVVMIGGLTIRPGRAQDNDVPDNALATPDRGKGDTIRNGRDEQGNVVMGTSHAHKPQEMPQMGPIYVVPQVNGPGPRPRVQQPGGNPVTLPAPARTGQGPAQPVGQSQPAGQTQGQSQPQTGSQSLPAGQNQTQ